MTSLQFPQKEYHRAGTLGEGAFGAVVVAYDDDGGEFACKKFNKWDADGEEMWGDEEDGEDPGLDVGVLREVAMLRMLNGAHPNVLTVADVSTMEGAVCMVMPKLAGTLAGAIEKQTLGNKEKLRVAAIALHSLAFLHGHGIIHRDLKPDNLLMTEDGAPVLADFSLAKVITAAEPAAAKAAAGGGKKKGKAEQKKAKAKQAGAAEEAAAVLTAGMGTPTYTAPEIVAGESYGLKADVFSMGVVLYELFHGSGLDAMKDKHALAQIAEIRAKLSDKPLPGLLKAMLAVDPDERPTAREAVQMLPGADKILAALRPTGPLFDMPPPPAADDDDDASAAAEGGAVAAGGKRKGGGAAAPSKRQRKHCGGGGDGGEAHLGAARICEALDAQNAQSASHAADYYARSAVARASGLEGAAVCALIGLKMFEPEAWCFADLDAVGLDELDMDVLPALELEVLTELGYCLLHTPDASKAEQPAASALSEKN